MRLAMLAALAGWFGFVEPALALDKVKFATNWLADPEAGGFFQAAEDGTYAKYGLDVTIIPGGPQSNGALMLLFGRIDFFMGGDLIGDFMTAESKLPLVAVAADFQKSPQILMSHPNVGRNWWCARHTEHHAHAHSYSFQRELPMRTHDSLVSSTGVDMG